MYRLVVVEDDRNQCEAIELLLSRHPRKSECSLEAVGGVAELKVLLDAGGPSIDVLLMDIALGAGNPSGIEVVSRYFGSNGGTQVIYITGYAEYCTKVYETEHVYFLVKPVEQHDFNNALDKALANVEIGRNRQIVVRSGGNAMVLLPHTIDYIESDRRKLCIHVGGRTVETYSSIADMAAKLPSSFVQCHKSFLVNMDCIQEFGGNCLLLASGETFPVSRTKRKTAFEAFLAYIEVGHS